MVRFTPILVVTFEMPISPHALLLLHTKEQAKPWHWLNLTRFYASDISGLCIGCEFRN